MTLNLKVDSSWDNEAENAYVNVSGDWKIVQSAWGNLDGTWQQLHAIEVLDKLYRMAPGNGFNNVVYSMPTQSDGKILAGGSFTTLNGATRNRLVRLNADGTEDTAFYTNLGTGFSSTVVSMAIQSDDKIIVGGAFLTLNGINRNFLVRLNTDGTVDSSFQTNLGSGFDNVVYSIAIQSDGKILVGGLFTTLNGASRNRLVRLNADGTEDTAFYTNLGTGFNGTVNYLTVQPDNSILAGGSFATLNGASRNRLVRLNSNGTEDTAFYTNLGTGFNSTIYSIGTQSDGKIVVAGQFTTLNGVSKKYLVRLNSNGTEDTAFYTNLGTGFNSYILSMAIQSDGKIVVGGNFSSLNSVSRVRLLRLNADGTDDTTFNNNLGTGLNSLAYSIAMQPDGKILVGGLFGTINGFTRNNLVRFNSDGTEAFLSVTRYLGLNGQVQKILVQSDGKILIVGSFSYLTEYFLGRILRLNSDGTIDTTFTSNLGTGFNSLIYSIAIQSDGKILVGGLFTTLNGASRNRLVRLNSNGTEDSSFYSNLGTGFNSTVQSIGTQSDGKIVVAGQFTTLNGVSKKYLVRLNSNGTEDTAFYTNLGTGFNNYLTSMVVQSDNKVLTGGAFTTLNGVTRNRLVRLNSDGTEDTAFYTNLGTGLNSIPYFLGIQTDGKILVGGIFSTLNGVTRRYLVRLNSNGTDDTAFNNNLGTGFSSIVRCVEVQSDGKFIVGGDFTTLNGVTKNRLVRLNADGTEDTAFYTNLGTGFNSTVYSIVAQSDGKILLGGDFQYSSNRYFAPYFAVLKKLI